MYTTLNSANDIVAALYRGQHINFIFMGILADTLVQKGGYNPTDAANAEKGPRAAELAREFLGSNNSTSSSNTGYSGNAQSFEDILNRSKQYSQELINPAIEQVRSQIPKIEQTYGAEQTRLQGTKQSVTDRYKNLITQIKGNQVQAETGARDYVTESMAQRGFGAEPGGVTQKNILNAVNPITSEYTGKLTEATGLEGQELGNIDQLISNLAMGQVGATGDINTQIANLLSGGASTALNTAQNLYGTQQSTAQSEAARQMQQDQFNKQLAQNIKEYETISLPTSKASLSKTYADIANSKNTLSNQKEFQKLLADALKGNNGIPQGKQLSNEQIKNLFSNSNIGVGSNWEVIK